jgi:signal transduction histidine kinase
MPHAFQPRRVSTPRGREVALRLFALPAEALVDAGRLVLAALALLTTSIDPVQPAGSATIVRGLLIAYLIFVMVLLAVPAERKSGGRLQLALHAIDIAVFSALMHYGEGPTGRFFPFYNFALIAATLRWSWRGALATALVLVSLMLLMTLFDSGPAHAHMPTRLIMRAGNLLVVGVLLAALGAYLDKSRDRLARLAAWPREDLGDGETPALAASLRHAASVIGSERIVVAWEDSEEPFLQTAHWTGESCEFARHPETRLSEVVVRELDGRSFYAFGPAGRVLLPFGSKPIVAAVKPSFAESFAIGVSCSAPFAGRDVAGRVFILAPGPFTPGLLHLAEIVAARIGAELEQFGLRSALANAAILRERARLARDLHDGLLQDLTAARLTIKSLTNAPGETTKADLEEIAGMLGEHQQRIRGFVKAVNPKPVPDWDFAAEFVTLTAMLERQWQCEVVATLHPADLILPGSLGYQVFLIFGEAMANAVQHGHSRRIAVDVARKDQRLHMLIKDDGCGLPHREGGGMPGPFSLRQRVSDLGGTLQLATSGQGVELAIDLPIP